MKNFLPICVLFLLSAIVLSNSAIAQGETTGETTMREVRTIKPGRWDDPDIWERWNGAAWTPLLPGQFPGCPSLKQVRVVVEHPVVVPYGYIYQVSQVVATATQNLQVEGELIADLATDYIDSSYLRNDPSVVAERETESGLRLGGAYPNPVIAKNGLTTLVNFTIDPDKSYPWVRISLFNERGVEVRTVAEYPNIPSGRYTMKIDLSDLPSGNYHVVLDAPGVRRSRLISLVK